MVLPILTFDEHALSPRFGYVFDAAWLEPHESILGMLWKFMRANRPPAAAVVSQIGARPIDGYAGLKPSPPDVDALAVASRRTKKMCPQPVPYERGSRSDNFVYACSEVNPSLCL
jgi:hypothetical protein